MSESVEIVALYDPNAVCIVSSDKVAFPLNKNVLAMSETLHESIGKTLHRYRALKGMQSRGIDIAKIESLPDDVDENDVHQVTAEPALRKALSIPETFEVLVLNIDSPVLSAVYAYCDTHAGVSPPLENYTQWKNLHPAEVEYVKNNTGEEGLQNVTTLASAADCMGIASLLAFTACVIQNIVNAAVLEHRGDVMKAAEDIRNEQERKVKMDTRRARYKVRK